VLCLLRATASCTILVQKNQFPELNWQIFIFSQSILLSGVRYSAPVEMLLHLIKSATDFFIRVSFLVQRLTLLVLNIV